MGVIDPGGTLPAKEKKLLWRNWLRWGVLLLACFFYTWFYAGFLSYTMLYLVALLPVVSLLALLVNLFTFRISETLNERIFVKGENAMYQLILANESPLPIPYVAISMYLEGQILCRDMKSLHLSLHPFAKKTYEYGMPLPYRGRYSVGVDSIVFRDFLGLFFLRHRPLERKSILVKPRVRLQAHRRVPAAMVSEGNELAGLFEPGNDELVDIRQYVPGDSLRKVHWKLTAKVGTPMVRDMRNELDNDILLVLDVTAAPEQTGRTLLLEDGLIEECVSQTQYLLAQSLPVRLCFWREEPVVLRAITPGDFQKAYELLSEVKFNQEGRFEELLDNFLDTGRHRSLVFLFTVQLTNELIEKAIALRFRGFDLELFYLLPPGTDTQNLSAGAPDRSIAEQMDRHGIRVHRLTVEPVDAVDTADAGNAVNAGNAVGTGRIEQENPAARPGTEGGRAGETDEKVG
jgi:hypothetical protein